MWDFSLIIEQDVSDKKHIGFSEIVVFRVNWATNRNSICSSFSCS